MTAALPPTWGLPLALLLLALRPAFAQQATQPIHPPANSPANQQPGAVAQQVPAKTLLATLFDGRVLEVSALTGTVETGFVLATAGGGEVRVGAGELLALQGGPVLESGLPCAWLAGGDVVRGALVGGDSNGDQLELLSPVLERVALQVDRLTQLAPLGVPTPQGLRLPDGVDEALFRRARFGYDVIAGAVHEFGARGIRFLPTGAAEPRWYALTELVGLRIADPLPRAVVAAAELWTRTGDRLSVTMQRATGATLQCTLEGGHAVELRWADVAALSLRGVATHLSDLVPKQVREAGFDGEVVHPWQRDRAVLGGPLVAGGRSYGKGLGVHSRSRLSYVVPEDAARFWTRVAIDDTAAALVVRADVDVRVLVDGKVAFEHKGLNPGMQPLDSGQLPVAAGQTVVLEVDFGVGRELGDRVVWLLPMFLPGAAKKP